MALLKDDRRKGDGIIFRNGKPSINGTVLLIVSCFGLDKVNPFVRTGRKATCISGNC